MKRIDVTTAKFISDSEAIGRGPFDMRNILAITLIFAAISVAADEPDIRVFQGRVMDHKGKPLKGAAVEWGYFMEERDKREVVRTDGDGKFTLETRLVGPDFRLGASAAGFAPSWRDGLIPRRKGRDVVTVDFKLTRPETLRGVVVDENGKPIEGAIVGAKSPTSGFYSSFSTPTPSHPYPGPPREARTNARGEFAIRNLPKTGAIVNPKDQDAMKGSAYEVYIKTPDSRMPRGKAFSGEDNQIQIRRSYVIESMELRGLVRCRVKDAQTNKAISKFRVVRRHQAKMLPFENSDGEFEIECSSRGRRYQFFVYAAGYSPGMIHITAGDSDNFLPVEILLNPKESLQGRVVDSVGMPISGAVVVSGTSKSKQNRFWWGSFDDYVDGHMGLSFVQRNKTLQNGEFQICQRGDPFVIAIKAPGYARRYVSVAEQSEMMKNGVLVIPLEPESQLEVLVKLNGKTEPNASVRLSETGQWDMDFGELRADDQGKLLVQGLSAGDYRVSVYQHSGSLGTVRLSRQVVLDRGKRLDVTLDNPKGKCTVAGKAAPFSLVSVSPSVSDDKTIYRTIGAKADPEGNYKIAGLNAGKYEISANVPSALAGFRSKRYSKEIEVKGYTMHNIDDRNPLIKINLDATVPLQ